MKSETTPYSSAGDKQEAILFAATDAFAQYGFRRVSMDEIARRAGMSRAALYLHFRNKEDIFATIVRVYFDGATEAMRAGLASADTPVESLKAAFAAKIAPPYDRLMDSPHGEELLDLKTSAAEAVVIEGEARMVAVLADWLAAAGAAGQLSLAGIADPAAAARTLLDAAHGVIYAARDYAALRSALDQLATMIGQGLCPGGPARG